MNIVVAVPDGRIVVDGLALRCEFASDATHSIRWNGAEGVGHVMGGPNEGPFRDPAIIAPYVAAWRAAMQRLIAATEAAQGQEQAAYQAWLAAEAQREEQLRAAAAAGEPTATQ